MQLQPTNSITITANNRPHYLTQSLEALSRASGVNEWHLFVGLEPGNEACAQICRNINFMPATILYNDEQLGVRGNPYNVLRHAFDAGSELNIHLEDDIVVSPDVCELAKWYHNLVPKDELFDVQVFFLNLFVTSTGGAVNELTASDYFSPWGMVFNRYQWENLIEPYWWDDEHRFKHEADWTLSLAERMNNNSKLVVLAPLLSRTTNIGRENGVHSNPARWDLLMNGLKMNKDCGPFEYRINARARIPWRRVNYEAMSVEDAWKENVEI